MQRVSPTELHVTSPMQRRYPPVQALPTAQIKPPIASARRPFRWAVVIAIGGIALLIALLLALGAGLSVLYSSGRILPGVTAAGISLRGLSVDDAAARLKDGLSQIVLRDGAHTWTIPAAQLGVAIDARATALNAQLYGRGQGTFLAAFIHQQVTPVVTVDATQAEKGLKAFAAANDRPAANATIRLVNGQVSAVPSVDGRILDVKTTLSHLVSAPDHDLTDGALDLVMTITKPTVTDASPLLDRTRTLLSSPLAIDAYDPISNQTQHWSVPVQQWGAWLTTQNTPAGLSLSLVKPALTTYMTAQSSSLGSGKRLNLDEGVSALESAIAASKPNATLRVYHTPTRYTVTNGDTLDTISWQAGIPMWRITQANPGINLDALSIGQVITLPSKDDMLPLPIIYGKRIVISITKQHMWVYDSGQLKWDWIASTGISSSPTMPGVYQVQSHEPNAYAGNWNLYMPWFMGIYDAVPGFTNGIHGFPSRGGYQILWQNDLGTRVTFGCILLSSTNAQALYNWAQEGVVVEIQP